MSPDEGGTGIATPPVQEAAPAPRGIVGRLGRSFRAIDPVNFALPIGVLVAWWTVAASDLVPDVLLPDPPKVVATMLEWFSADFGGEQEMYYTGTWLSDALGSTFRALTGFLIGSSAAIVVGVAVGWSRMTERIVDPTIQLLRPMPRTALLPFAIIFFGLGNAPALFLVVYGTFLQVYIQVVMGVKLVGRDYRRAAGMLGASDPQILRRVIIPGALPYIFTGLRLGVAYAWTLMILAEMFAVPSGFGYILWRGYEFMRMDIVLAGMFMLGIFGFVSDRIIVIIARRKLDWAQEQAGTLL